MLGGLLKYNNSLLLCNNFIIFGCGISYHAGLLVMIRYKKNMRFQNDTNI